MHHFTNISPKKLTTLPNFLGKKLLVASQNAQGETALN
jgi:hypothetical protein